MQCGAMQCDALCGMYVHYNMQKTFDRNDKRSIMYTAWVEDHNYRKRKTGKRDSKGSTLLGGGFTK